MSPLWRILAASFILLAFVTAWFLYERGPTPAPLAPAQTPLPVPAEREQPSREVSAADPAPVPSLPSTMPPVAETPTPPPPKPSSGEASVAALEQRIRATRDTEERSELIAELAHRDSAEAVLALERLFTVERHPKVQTALIASLLEVNSAVLPDARLRILRAAVTGQPREVRTTALEVLAESSDAAARELLRKSSVSDPDHEVREVAAALYEANSR
jgi:type IV secretory pathway VirB10-like protein